MLLHHNKDINLKQDKYFDKKIVIFLQLAIHLTKTLQFFLKLKPTFYIMILKRSSD